MGPCDLGAFESQGFTLGSLTGNSQQADVNTAFAQPLGLTVTANNASEPVIGGKVTFTPPGSGPSAAITGSPATIGAGGGASVTATANGIASWYPVTASASGASDVQFYLMNLWDLNVTLTSLPNPSGQGQSVTFTATVTSTSGPTPTGTVQFYADGTPLGSAVALSSGQASMSTSALAIGTHQITAEYSGDTNFRPGTSPIHTQTVNLAPIMYAQPGGATSGYCESWANACELSYALISSAAGQEIWVRAGAYKPTTTDPNPRKGTFQLKNGVAVYGGFNGTESTRNQRNPTTNVVILSGDLNGNDSGSTNNGENSYHVVTGANGATLDGVTISGGNANETLSPDDRGAGMYNSSSSPTLANVTFSGNNAQLFGGGMCNWWSSSPTLTNVTFTGNSAVWAGGGMYNELQQPDAHKRHFHQQLRRIRRRAAQHVQQPDPDRRHLHWQLGFVRWRRDVELHQQQPDLDERRLQRQLCPVQRRRDVQLLQRQPDADQRHLQRQLGLLGRRNVQYQRQQPDADQHHLQRQYSQ